MDKLLAVKCSHGLIGARIDNMESLFYANISILGTALNRKIKHGHLIDSASLWTKICISNINICNINIITA